MTSHLPDGIVDADNDSKEEGVGSWTLWQGSFEIGFLGFSGRGFAQFGRWEARKGESQGVAYW